MQELIKKIRIYTEERNWDNLDSADLAKSIMIEAAELLECYQWDNTTLTKEGKLPEKSKEKISSEAADVFIYLLQFCIKNDIDLLDASRKKIDHNCKKYPAKNMKDGGQDAYDKAKSEYRKNNK